MGDFIFVKIIFILRVLNFNEVNSAKCDFLSHVVSVDTKGDEYDLLLSFSTLEVINLIFE